MSSYCIEWHQNHLFLFSILHEKAFYDNLIIDKLENRKISMINPDKPERVNFRRKRKLDKEEMKHKIKGKEYAIEMKKRKYKKEILALTIEKVKLSKEKERLKQENRSHKADAMASVMLGIQYIKPE